MLAAIGRVLKAWVRRNDTVARIGNDEFVLILAEIGDDELHALLERLLELELTESLSMDSPEKSIALLGALKALGVTLTLDDFGTGYSN